MTRTFFLSNSLLPHGLYSPWNSPGQNTGVDSVQFSCSVMSDYLWPHGLQHTRLPWTSPTPGACSNSCQSSRWCHLSHLLLSPSPPAFNLFQHQGLFQWVSSSQQVPKYWSINFSISPCNEYSELISFKIDCFGLLCSPGDSQESSPTSQFKRINSPVLSFLYGPLLTSIHDLEKP